APLRRLHRAPTARGREDAGRRRARNPADDDLRAPGALARNGRETDARAANVPRTGRAHSGSDTGGGGHRADALAARNEEAERRTQSAERRIEKHESFFVLNSALCVLRSAFDSMNPRLELYKSELLKWNAK